MGTNIGGPKCSWFIRLNASGQVIDEPLEVRQQRGKNLPGDGKLFSIISKILPLDLDHKLSRTQLGEIVEYNVIGVCQSDRLVVEALDLIVALRLGSLVKPPTVSELLSFVTLLLKIGYTPAGGFAFDEGRWERFAIPVLLKTVEDQASFSAKGSLTQVMRPSGRN